MTSEESEELKKELQARLIAIELRLLNEGRITKEQIAHNKNDNGD